MFAEIIAIGALATSIASVLLARKTAILSMRPKLVATRHMEITNGGRTLFFEFAVENVGIGPAMYRDIKLFFNGERINGTIYDDLPLELLKKCFPSWGWPNSGQGNSVRLEKHGMPSTVGALRPGSQFLLARVRIDSDLAFSEEAIAKIRARFDQADYSVDYTSIYEERIWTCRP